MTGPAPYEVGDLVLAVGAYEGGRVEGGVIRRATSLVIPWRYHQTIDPTDVAVGTAVNVDWRATIGGGGGLGPQAQSHGFGPRGVFNLEGDVRYSKDCTPYAIAPIAFANMLVVANEPGVPRALAPSWSFVSAPMFLADGATVTHERTDVTLGGAGFVDSQVIGTVEDGEWDGTTNHAELLSFLSMPFVLGGAHISRRVAFDVVDLSGTWPTGHEAVAEAVERLTGATADPGTGVVDEQFGLRIERLSGATRNVGILNASATVHPPTVVPLVAGSATTLPIDATTLHLCTETDDPVELTSVPTVPDGLDGQRLTLVNVGAGSIAMSGEGSLPGSNLARDRALGSGDAVELSFSSSLGQWLALTDRAEVEREAPRRRIRSSGATASAIGSDDRNHILTLSTRTGSTLVYPCDADAQIPVGTEIPIINLGPALLLHVAGEGAQVVGSPTCPDGARQVATKIAPDLWHVG